MATVKGNVPFKCTTKSLIVGKTTGGYVFAYGTDKNNLTPYTEATPADECLIVNGMVPLSWACLSGCTDEEVTVIFHD